jgi:MATE family multidrug resistance protein
MQSEEKESRPFGGWRGEAEFRASLPVGILFFTLVCGFMALAGFTNTFVAQFWGAGDKAGCARATAQGILFSFISFPLIMLLTPAGLMLLRLGGHGADVLALEEEYLRILMWCGGGMTLSSALSSFFSGRGLTLVIMGCNIIANGINILLNYLLIFGKWGLPEMGIVGAGWATVIGSWVSPLIFAAIYFSRSVNADFGTRRNLRFDPWLFRRMIRFGLPSGIHWFLDVAAFTVFVMLVGRLGPVAHFASNIALSVNLLAFMPMIGIGMAASILVGQYLGRDEPYHAQRAGWLALRIGIGYILIISATFLLFPSFYTRLFSGQGAEAIPADALYRTTRILLAMLAVWGAADAAALIISGALKGAGDTHFVMYFQSTAAWGFLVLGQLLIVFVFHGGVYASWSWTLLYIMLLGTGFILRFRSGRWKSIDLLERRLPAVPDAVQAVQPGPELP